MNETIQILATGLKFPEGPVVMADGTVFLVEIAGGVVTRVGADGSVSTVARTGGGPNGLALGPDGALYVCNNGGGRYVGNSTSSIGPALDYDGGMIQRVDPHTGDVRVLYTHCGDQRLSAPNDLVFDAVGGFYFSDIGKRHDLHRDHGGVYYARPEGGHIRQVAHRTVTANGVGLSLDGSVLYVAETETSRLWAYDVVTPGELRLREFPSPNGGRLVHGLPGFQRFDSLAVEANGNICIGTLHTGQITVLSPEGHLVRQVQMPDAYPTNICFGGVDMMTAFITLSHSGQLVSMPWPEPGLRLHNAA